jgi:hypothetical protein
VNFYFKSDRTKATKATLGLTIYEVAGGLESDRLCLVVYLVKLYIRATLCCFLIGYGSIKQKRKRHPHVTAHKHSNMGTIELCVPTKCNVPISELFLTRAGLLWMSIIMLWMDSIALNGNPPLNHFQPHTVRFVTARTLYQVISAHA